VNPTEPEQAALFAITRAKKLDLAEVGPDELLLGCLQTRARFGIVELGPWTFDLEALGIDWLEDPGPRAPKMAYSEGAVEIFDRAARIAKSVSAAAISVEHLLAAFAPEESGLMGDLKRAHSITSAAWRAALISGMDRAVKAAEPAPEPPVRPAQREFLTPEEAAEALGVHVQTLRAYVRSGKLPALRLAGERAIRIRRGDLEKVFEPVEPEKTTERN
jgi:excisionase family DNA binding protein